MTALTSLQIIAEVLVLVLTLSAAVLGSGYWLLQGVLVRRFAVRRALVFVACATCAYYVLWAVFVYPLR